MESAARWQDAGGAWRGLAIALAAVVLVACGKGEEAGGPLRVATVPGGADVYVNEQHYGVSPQAPGEALPISLPSGRYEIEARRQEEFAEYRGRLTHVFDSARPGPVLVLNLERGLTEAGRARDEAEAERLTRLAEAALARFEPQDDGTVVEVAAGLMWMRCSLGQSWVGATCSGQARQLNWDQALKAAEATQFAGHADWRLPTQAELYALTHCTSGMRSEPNREGLGGGCVGDYRSPTILESVFPDTPIGNFWTSTPHARFNFSAWGVSFNTGHTGTGGRSDYVHVRLVRDLH